MAIVVFDPANFREAFPQFSDAEKYPGAMLEQAFETATLYLKNTDCAPVPYDPARGIYDRRALLYMLVCHLLTLRDHGTIGIPSSATEGSVSAGFSVPNSAAGAWFQQTQCGYMFWQAIKKYIIGGRYYPFYSRHTGL